MHMKNVQTKESVLSLKSPVKKQQTNKHTTETASTSYLSWYDISRYVYPIHTLHGAVIIFNSTYSVIGDIITTKRSLYSVYGMV